MEESFILGSQTCHLWVEIWGMGFGTLLILLRGKFFTCLDVAKKTAITKMEILEKEHATPSFLLHEIRAGFGIWTPEQSWIFTNLRSAAIGGNFVVHEVLKVTAMR